MNKCYALLLGLEPRTFRLTAGRDDQFRHKRSIVFLLLIPIENIHGFERISFDINPHFIRR